METLNERIKKLRKEKGLTQSQLADKLGVTDKAVSKWEVGEANPDISLLVNLANIFDVSVDYLLTGKVEESISLEDMDEHKRALHLIKKDDLGLFEKYGYIGSSILLTAEYVRGGRGDKNEEMLQAIYENESKKIFKACLNAAINSFGNSKAPNVLHARQIRGDFDEYIKMCCKANCLNGLEFVDFKYLMLGNKTNVKDGTRYQLRHSYNPTDNGFQTFIVSRTTFDFIFSYKNISEEIIDYFVNAEFYQDKGDKICNLHDAILCELYRNGFYDKVEKLITRLESNNKFAKEVYDESVYGNSWYTGKQIKDNAIYFLNSGNFYMRASVVPIKQAVELAKTNTDFKWLKRFNEYNKQLSELIPDLKLRYIKEDAMKLLELEADKNAPLEEVLSLRHVKYGVLNLYGLLGDDSGIESTDEVERLKEKIKKVKEYREFIKKNYISPYELIMSLVGSKNSKELFEFAADLQYADLENAIIDGNKDLVKTLAADLFLPSEEIVRSFLRAKSNANNINCSGGTEEESRANTELARKKEISDARGKANSKYFEEKKNEYGRHLNQEMYSSLLNLQVGNIPLDEYYLPLTLDFIRKEKDRVCDEYLEKLDDIIERITNRKALEKEYNKITNELNRDYLLSELNRGEADKVVVLICKRLQILLQSKYGYSGDLFTMIDTLIDKTMRLHNCYDDEDNNYSLYMEEDRVFTKRIQLLHKLRMKRNNIVHPEIKEVEMSLDEIKECIDLIELLSK